MTRPNKNNTYTTAKIKSEQNWFNVLTEWLYGLYGKNYIYKLTLHLRWAWVELAVASIGTVGNGVLWAEGAGVYGSTEPGQAPGDKFVTLFSMQDAGTLLSDCFFFTKVLEICS